VAPSPTATATEIPQIVVAVPPIWLAPAQQAAAQNSQWRWHIEVSEEPGTVLESGRAQLALVGGEGEPHAGTQPLALTVPFSTDWDSVSLAQAQEILANGHQLVEVVPWPEVQASQRALYVDGRHVSAPDYPLQQPWHIRASQGHEEAATALATQLAQRPLEETVQLAAVGDVMLDRALGTVIAGGDVAYPFLHVQAYLQQADLTLANVESALGDTGSPVDKSYTFRAPPAAARSLASAGIDVASLANNHALDYGPEALLQGIGLLQAEGITPVGAGPNAAAARAPAIVEVEGLTLAVLAYANVPVEGGAPYFDTQSWTATESQPGLAWGTPQEIAADVAAAANSADHVIVLLHSGYEYVPAPSPEQRAAAYAAVDAGATLVIGHHAHILQGVEFYNEGVIVYGLGNFAFNITGPPETAILNVWLNKTGERAAAVRQIEFIPAVIQGTGQPAPVSGEEAAAIRRGIYLLSAGLH
jgi:poly-gamma-glutamate synthesis protein (capsule biosynthesis protein)